MSGEKTPESRRPADDPRDILPRVGEWDERTLPDRRRPGRVRHVTPALIAMLRRPAEPAIAPYGGDDNEPFPRDDLRAARGIILAAAIGLICWAVLVAVVVWVIA